MSWFTNLQDPTRSPTILLSLDLTYQTTCRLDATPMTTVSKTDFSGGCRSRGNHNGSRRGHVTAHSTVRGARATLVVTLSARDCVKSKVNIYASVKYRFYRK